MKFICLTNAQGEMVVVNFGTVHTYYPGDVGGTVLNFGADTAWVKESPAIISDRLRWENNR